MSVGGLLSEHQTEVARRVLAEESAKRAHVVVYLSGAHAYGFPSPDSDLDLKAIHVAPTESLLGLHALAPTFDRAEIIESVEIDYTSNELGHALAGILAGNGNFLERVLGATTVTQSAWLDELRPLASRSLSRRVHRHYAGFARGQLRELDAKPTVKRLLYVIRTALTGTHLLRSGELVTDVTRLLDENGVADARALIDAKRAGERSDLGDGVREEWRDRVTQLLAVLDDAVTSSPLPAEPANEAQVEAWLVSVRRRILQGDGS